MSLLPVPVNNYFVACILENDELKPLKFLSYEMSQHSREKSYDVSTTTYQMSTKFDQAADFFNINQAAKKELKSLLAKKGLSVEHLKLVKIEFSEPKQSFYEPKLEDFIL